jgi:hypothetical protein
LLGGGEFVNGKRTAELADIVHVIHNDKPSKEYCVIDKVQTMENIYKLVIDETAREMAQHCSLFK